MRVLGVVGRQDFYGGGEYNLDLRGFGATADNNQVVIVDGLRLQRGRPRRHAAGRHPDRIGRAHRSAARQRRRAVRRRRHRRRDRHHHQGGHRQGAAQRGLGLCRRRQPRAARPARRAPPSPAAAFRWTSPGQKRDTDNHRDNFRSETRRGLGHRPVVQRLAAPGRARRRATRWTRGLPGGAHDGAVRGQPAPDHHAERQGATSATSAAACSREAQLGNWQLGADAGRREKKPDQPQQRLPVRLRHRRDQLLAARAPRGARWAARRTCWCWAPTTRAGRRDVLGAFGSTAEPALARLVRQGRRHAGRRHAPWRRLPHREDRQGQQQRRRPAWRTASMPGSSA